MVLFAVFGGAVQGAEGRPPVVAVGKVVLVKGETARKHVGTVVPIEEVEVTARVSGTLEKRFFKEGDFVKKGQLLYQLEDVSYKAALDALKAARMKAEASMTLAESEYRRRSALFSNGVLTKTENDTVYCTYLTAKAALLELDAKIRDAENTYSYTKIKAAQDGMISRSRFSEGNLVSPASGSLATIKLMSPIYVRFNLSAKVFQRDFGGMSKIRDTADVSIKLSDGTQYGEHARVTLVDNKVNSSTDSITLWATFQNRDLALLPGAFVTVMVIPSEMKTACAVLPSALIMERDGSYVVYVCGKDNVIEARKVRLGSTTGDGLQIVLDGLKEGETVVTDGMHKVRPGVTCTPAAGK